MTDKAIYCDGCSTEHKDISAATLCCEVGSGITVSEGNEEWEEYVEEQIHDIQFYLECALRACEDRNQRGALTAIYNDVLTFKYRHYDSYE